MAKGHGSESRERQQRQKQQQADKKAREQALADWDAEKANLGNLAPEDQYDRYMKYGKEMMPDRPGGSGWGNKPKEGLMNELIYGSDRGGQTPDKVYEQLWGGYVGFQKQAGQAYEQNLSSSIVRMAAGGLAVGSQEWNATLERLDTRYKNDLENIKAGETYGMLKEYAKDKGTTGFSDYWYGKEFGGELYTPNRYEERQAGISPGQKLVGGGTTKGPSGSFM